MGEPPETNAFDADACSSPRTPKSKSKEGVGDPASNYPGADAGDRCNSTGDPLEEVRRLERLMSERMDQFEEQLRELKQQVLRGATFKPMRSSTENKDDADPDKDPVDPAAVTPKRLDYGDRYELRKTIWDASMFVFHPCLGTLVSIVTVFVWALNIGLQVWFCMMVINNMLESDVSTDTLDSILRYRIVAHSVEFSDHLTSKSMVHQVCNGEVPGKLHQSGAQAALYRVLSEFQPSRHGGGRSIMGLVQLIWVCFILQELNEVYNFARSLTHVGLSDRTWITMTEHADERVGAIYSTRTLFGNRSVGLTNVTSRLRNISTLRYWSAMVLIVIPRLAIAILMGTVGCAFLGKTSNIEELVLNAMALTFIADIDDLLYVVLVPRRAQTLLHNLEALPLVHHWRKNTAGLWAVFKMSIVGGVMTMVYFLILFPFFWRMEMAEEILCGGNQDFVWSINRASEMVHVTRSQDEVEVSWTQQELVILQVAQPELANDHWPTLSEDAMTYASSTQSRSIWEPDISGTGSYSTASYDVSQFALVRSINEYSIAEASELLGCSDLNSGQFTELSGGEVVDIAVVYLQEFFKDYTIRSCSDISWQYCAMEAGNQIRALCPVRCGCDTPSRYYFGLTGFYQSAEGGCPTQCKILAGARNELLYSLSDYAEARYTESFQDMGSYSCTDIQEHQFTSNAPSCVDLDQFGRAWNAVNMTCKTAECVSVNDDEDFTAKDMCCKCGGGQTESLGESSKCIDVLHDDCLNMDLPAFAYMMYIRGLHEQLHHTSEYGSHVLHIIFHPDNLLSIEDDYKDDLLQYVMNGSFKYSLMDGNWNLMPGVPHPRRLSGCEFLASFEVKALLGFDICLSESTQMSLRLLCPQTCGCTQREYNRYVTREAGSDTETVEYTTTEGTITRFSLERTALHDCPASCIIPHPVVTDTTSRYDAYEFWGAI